MRYKTIADFGAYTVVEPTEPVKKIQTINICRKPVQMNRTQHKQISHKRRKKVEKELNYSAYMTTAVTFFFYCKYGCFVGSSWILGEENKSYDVQ